MSPIQPELPDPVAPTDMEQAYREDEPGGLFPPNQDSNFGQYRKILTATLQDIADQIDLLFNENFVGTSTQFLNYHEEEVGLPALLNQTIEYRRQRVLSRLKKGMFTRVRRAEIIEAFIYAVQGAATVIGTGVPLGSGVTLYSGDTIPDAKVYYKVTEDIPNFIYHVRIDETLGIDLIGLIADLTRVTPGGINFDVTQVVDPYATGTMTMSGNEITDAVRTAQGPVGGYLAGTGAGIGTYIAHTNYAYNTLCTSATGFGTLGTRTLTGGDTSQADNPFASVSHQALKIVTTAVNSGTVWPATVNPNAPAAASGQAWGSSCWVKGPAGSHVQIGILGYDSTKTTNTETFYSASIAFTGSWQRISFRGVLANASTAAVVAALRAVETGVTFYATAPMLTRITTNGLIDFPYIANSSTTAGTTTTRNTGRIRVPASLLSEAQGWVAFSFNPSYTSPYGGTTNSMAWSWSDGTSNNFLSVRLDSASNFIDILSSVGGVQTAKTFGYAAVEGQPFIVVVKWDANFIYISVNGAPFLSIAWTGTHASFASTLQEIGSLNGGQNANGNYHWFACGKGVLTDADAATLGALGNTAPGLKTLPAAAEITASMKMLDSSFDEYDDNMVF